MRSFIKSQKNNRKGNNPEKAFLPIEKTHRWCLPETFKEFSGLKEV